MSARLLVMACVPILAFVGGDQERKVAPLEPRKGGVLVRIDATKKGSPRFDLRMHAENEAELRTFLRAIAGIKRRDGGLSEVPIDIACHKDCPFRFVQLAMRIAAEDNIKFYKVLIKEEPPQPEEKPASGQARK